MEPNRVSPLEGAFNFFEALAKGRAGPKETINDKVGDRIIVDTCLAGDTDQWETGIKRDGEPWIIVEQYADKDAAVKGHAHWVKLTTDEPDFPLKDIDQWNLESLRTED